jgi:hypothetical protein
LSSGAPETGRRTPTRGHRRWFAAGFIALLLSTPAAGQDDELARLHEEAAALRQALDRLDARIRVLEGKSGTASAAPAYSTSLAGLALLKRGWSQIDPGMPGDKVEALLGKPGNILHIDNTLVWYYIYPEIGRGSVFFDSSGRVSSKQAPALGW